VLLADAGRPRNAATLRSHRFLIRDGVPPIELRKLGLAELSTYPDGQVAERTPVSSRAAASRVDRRPIDDLEGERGTVTAMRLADGDSVPIAGGFVRPVWHPSLEFLTGCRTRGRRRRPLADGCLRPHEHRRALRRGRRRVPGAAAAHRRRGGGRARRRRAHARLARGDDHTLSPASAALAYPPRTDKHQ
jgi:hypothetical protein